MGKSLGEDQSESACFGRVFLFIEKKRAHLVRLKGKGLDYYVLYTLCEKLS